MPKAAPKSDRQALAARSSAGNEIAGPGHMAPSSIWDITVFKHTRDDRLGISLETGDKENVVVVKALAPGGRAEICGILAGDEVLSIGGTPYASALEAARALRESDGSVNVRVERRSGLSLSACNLSNRSGPTYSETNSDEVGDSDEYSDEHSDEDIVGQWEEYLDWMIVRIMEREDELRECQEETADALVQSMLAIREPEPPSDADMEDPEAMQLYMEAMAVYAQQQRNRLTELDGAQEAIDENRDASAALLLCTTRRQELEVLLGRVHTLTEQDAERIEEIWQELSGGLEDEEADVQEQGEEQGDDADESLILEATKLALGSRSCPRSHAQLHVPEPSSALERLREHSKHVRLNQRLQRARSGKMGAKPSAVTLASDDEVGCQIHPEAEKKKLQRSYSFGRRTKAS
jgi:hypothetical protein